MRLRKHLIETWHAERNDAALTAAAGQRSKSKDDTCFEVTEGQQKVSTSCFLFILAELSVWLFSLFCGAGVSILLRNTHLPKIYSQEIFCLFHTQICISSSCAFAAKTHNELALRSDKHRLASFTVYYIFPSHSPSLSLSFSPSFSPFSLSRQSPGSLPHLHLDLPVWK